MAAPKALFSTSALKAANAQPYSSMNGKLDPSLLRSLQEMGMVYMTPVQTKVMDMPSLRSDCLVRSKTGTGKTIAFLLPALQNLLQRSPKTGQIAVLVLSPTRELALQIAAEADRLVKNVSVHGRQIEVHTAFGGTARASSLSKLKRGDPRILVATPGRLNDILEEPDVKARFSTMQTLIIDEADAMLEAGFLPDVKRILSALPAKAKGDWQGMCFSATVPSKIKDVLSNVLKPGYTEISTLDESEPPTINGVPQFSIIIPHPEDVFSALLSLINIEAKATKANAKIIVFGTTANLVAMYADLYRLLLPFDIFELHSRLNQSQRTKTASAFKEATSSVMFATDVIGRGMDFPDVSLVIQAGLPANSDAYTHRVGRTARAGKSGRAVIILAEAESFYLKVNRQFPVEPYPDAVRILGDRASVESVEQALNKIDEKSKTKAYQAYLGFMKTFENKMRINSTQLVKMANQFAVQGMRCAEPPGLEKKVIGKMGLKGVPGLRIAQREVIETTNNQQPPNTSFSALKKRPGYPSPSTSEAMTKSTDQNGRPKRQRKNQAIATADSCLLRAFILLLVKTTAAMMILQMVITFLTGLAVGIVGTTYNLLLAQMMGLDDPRPVIHRPTGTYTVPPPTSTMGGTTVNYPVSSDGSPMAARVGVIFCAVIFSFAILRFLACLRFPTTRSAPQVTTGSVSATDPARDQGSNHDQFQDTIDKALRLVRDHRSNQALLGGELEGMKVGLHAWRTQAFPPLVKGAPVSDDQGGLGTSPLPDDASGASEGESSDACPTVVFNGKPRNRRTAQRRANKRWAARKEREKEERRKREEEGE
ncbi:MAG: hypothetical protein Q9228_003669 [Teloschistes exilis]